MLLKPRHGCLQMIHVPVHRLFHAQMRRRFPLHERKRVLSRDSFPSRFTPLVPTWFPKHEHVRMRPIASRLERQKYGNGVQTTLCHAPLPVLPLLHLKLAIPIHGRQATESLLATLERVDRIEQRDKLALGLGKVSNRTKFDARRGP